MAKGTVTQQILNPHIVTGTPKTGEKIAVKIDQTLTQDATGTMAYLELEAMNIDQVKTEISVSYIDHNTQQNGPENPNDHLYLQTVAAGKGIYFSRPGNGICHQVHLERFGVPGKTLLGSDSHTPTNGGIGMIAIGAGGLDVALAMAGKPFKMTYPKILGIKLLGKLSPWVTAKDIILKILQLLATKGNVGCSIEYFGPGVKTLSVPERATITNMGAELGVTFSIFPSDENTKKFLKAQGRAKSWKLIQPLKNVEYEKVIELDLSKIEPLAACPSSPDNIKTIKELSGTKVNQIIIGSCTNSSLGDLILVSKILEGKTIHPEVSLSIAPGSRQVLEILEKEGYLSKIIAAGARILETACGPCIGQGLSPATDTITLRTFNRNFAGRTGTKEDKAYLVSPVVAAAAALTGKITEPQKLKIKFPVIHFPNKYFINDNMIIPPLPKNKAEKIKIIRKPTIGKPPINTSLPNNIEGGILIKVGDKITTDHIMPAGIYLKYRSNIPEYSKVVFECFNQKGEPTFAERAVRLREAGKHGIIVAKDSYGQGSSREHAAICPMYLGIKAVIAIAIERIHAANLINFGIIPFIFVNPADYDLIEKDDQITIANINKQFIPNKTVIAKIINKTGKIKEIKLAHGLNQEEIDTILAGGVLNTL